MIARPRRLRARTRLTLWYVAVVATTLIGMGSLALWLVEQQLYANADDTLRSKAVAVVTEVEMDGGRLTFDDGDDDDNDVDHDASLVVGLDVVRIWDHDQRLVFHYGSIGGMSEVDPSVLDDVLAGVERYETIETGGTRVRLYLQPIRNAAGAVVGAVEVGRSQAEIDGLLARLRTLGLAGLVVTLAIAGVGGSFLAGRALRPVDRITRAAEEIGAEDLSLRLETHAEDDELGRLVAAFNGMIDRLEHAFRRQQRFTADASHELRTPLAAIRSLAEVARTAPRDEAYDARVYASICEESERLARLVESLLVLARADDGYTPELVRVDLDEVAMDAAGRMLGRARQQAVTLAVVPSEGCAVQGDASLLTQLVLNLLDNALHHTPPGGRITLSVEPTADGVALVVADTGIGIAPEHVPRLFERFYRADTARSRSTGGFGLGLAICEWIARVHAGDLHLESQVGVGTTARLWLPGVPLSWPKEAKAPAGWRVAVSG